MPGSRNKLSKKHILSLTVTNSTRNHFGSQLALGSVYGKFQRHVWQPLEWVPQPCSIFGVHLKMLVVPCALEHRRFCEAHQYAYIIMYFKKIYTTVTEKKMAITGKTHSDQFFLVIRVCRYIYIYLEYIQQWVHLKTQPPEFERMVIFRNEVRSARSVRKHIGSVRDACCMLKREFARSKQRFIDSWGHGMAWDPPTQTMCQNKVRITMNHPKHPKTIENCHTLAWCSQFRMHLLTPA